MKTKTKVDITPWVGEYDNKHIFYKEFDSFEQAWENCKFPWLMLRLAYELEVDMRKIMEIKVIAAKHYLDEMKDNRSKRAVEFAERYVAGEVSEEVMHLATLDAVDAFEPYATNPFKGFDPKSKAKYKAARAAKYVGDFESCEVIYPVEVEKEMIDACQRILTAPVYEQINALPGEKIYQVRGKDVIIDTHLARIFGADLKELREYLLEEMRKEYNNDEIFQLTREEGNEIGDKRPSLPIATPLYQCPTFVGYTGYIVQVERNLQATKEIIGLIESSEKDLDKDTYHATFKTLVEAYRNALDKVKHQRVLFHETLKLFEEQAKKYEKRTGTH